MLSPPSVGSYFRSYFLHKPLLFNEAVRFLLLQHHNVSYRSYCKKLNALEYCAKLFILVEFKFWIHEIYDRNDNSNVCTFF